MLTINDPCRLVSSRKHQIHELLTITGLVERLESGALSFRIYVQQDIGREETLRFSFDVFSDVFQPPSFDESLKRTHIRSLTFRPVCNKRNRNEFFWFNGEHKRIMPTNVRLQRRDRNFEVLKFYSGEKIRE